MTRRKALAVKGDVPRLVPQDEPAHLSDGHIPAMLPDETVVSRADDFHDQQHLHFKLGTEGTATLVEKTESEAVFDEGAPETPHRPGKQARMLRFFREPKIDDPFDIVVRSTESLRIAGDEATRTTSIAELILGEGRSEGGPLSLVQQEREIPFGFWTVEAVGRSEMADPLREVHGHGVSFHD
jgi:hypothetical protein